MWTTFCDSVSARTALYNIAAVLVFACLTWLAVAIARAVLGELLRRRYWCKRNVAKRALNRIQDRLDY